MHASSLAAMTWFVDEFLAGRRDQPLVVVDIGSMDVNGSYRPLFDAPRWQYTGVDAEAGPGVDVVLADPYRWSELPADSSDVVISGQAFEHIEFPWISALEVHRVLKPGGLVCLIVPSSGYEHRYPLDCWRYYPDGIAALARWADLDVLVARTEWEPQGDFPDDSALWKDTVLVARKPLRVGRWPWVTSAKQGLLRRVGQTQARRRQTAPDNVPGGARVAQSRGAATPREPWRRRPAPSRQPPATVLR